METPKAQLFRYQAPEVNHGKAAVRLASTGRVRAAVQVLKKGGENNLHYHRYQDGVWMVLSGRVRFYGEGDEVLGEFGPMEGILVPHGFQYWFESVGDEVAEILQVEAAVRELNTEERRDDRVNLTPLKPSFASTVHTDGRVSNT
jgi:mannose-6-phosphate isomerase-like protein (cupin superfamily)